jgi:hypothetical protein
MAFETPLTIMEALREIDRNKYALPALQREFVWKHEQICELFDSVMKGYPIGSFLFWKLEGETAREFQFYQFMRDYHARDRPFCDEFSMQTDGPEIAVLDGQQRLTAFNIAIYGSYAEKKKYVRRDSKRAYPVKHLYLNLLFDPREHEDANYDFAFLTEKEARVQDDAHLWFHVGKMREFEKSHHYMTYLARHDLGERMELAAENLGELFDVLHNARIISYFMEKEQNLDKVLNIFIRVNSGGTKLSYADLLLSMATSQWQTIDARKAINDLTQEMNSHGVEDRFNFNKDFILKAGLTLTGQPNVMFTSKNFTADKMRGIEANWSRISESLFLTIQLLEEYGFGRRHVRAASAAIVIAGYLFHKGYDERFLDRESHAEERAQIKRWFIQMNISNIWGGSFADKFLPRVMREFERMDTFECHALLDLTRQLGRDPYLDAERIDELLEMRYADKRVYLVLSLVFDSMQAHTKRGEVDHIYPKSLASKRALEKLGMSAPEIEQLKDRINRLPNLWLLAHTTNQEKGKQMPLEWFASIDTTTADHLIHFHHLQDLVDDLTEFDTFYEARKERLRPILLRMFGRPNPVAAQLDEPSEATTSLEEPSIGALVSGTSWSEDTLGILEERYHPLAQVLMAAGVPEPEDIDRELLQDGLTTSYSSLMNWSVGGKSVVLVEASTPVEGVRGGVVAMSAAFDDVAKELRGALGL